jgi:hemerythrin-like domain-containing protein
MEPMERKKKENYFDAISYFEYIQNTIMDLLNEMEKICKNSENKEISTVDNDKMIELNSIVHDKFLKYYTMEEDILFPELEKVLPSPTSTTSMRNEHTAILKLIKLIAELLEDRENLERNRQKIISSVISFVDVMQRHIHKKNNVMYHEVSSFLPEKKLEEIYDIILKKV